MFGRHKPHLFRRERPVNSALGVRYSLSLRRGSASFRTVRVERDRPFPDMPPDALNDRIFDAAMFHCALDYPSRAFFPSRRSMTSKSSSGLRNEVLKIIKEPLLKAWHTVRMMAALFVLDNFKVGVDRQQTAGVFIPKSCSEPFFASN